MDGPIVSLIPTIRAFCVRSAEIVRNPAIARLVRWAGWAALLAALAYLFLALRQYDWALLGAALNRTAWTLTFLCTVAYAAMLMVLASGWATLADRSRLLNSRDLTVIYGLGVLAKYLPGSLFQYAARQVRGSQRGLAQGAMAQASLVEGAMHLPAVLLAGLALWMGGGVTVLLLMAGGGFLTWRLVRSSMLRTAACQILFFSLLAVIALLLARDGLGLANPEHLAGAFMLAWAAGFLVPVAPGGIGIREAALLALVSSAEMAVSVGNFALLMRVVTTAGDALLGLAAYGLALGTRENRQASV